jgi:hypothetical protein
MGRHFLFQTYKNSYWLGYPVRGIKILAPSRSQKNDLMYVVIFCLKITIYIG